VLGPSGSGKTTLLRAILGEFIPQDGCIHLGNRDITHLPIERRGLGYVPQHIGLFPHLNVRENLLYSSRARGLPHTQVQPLLQRLVAETGIGDLMERWPQTLSGGERQRVGIVRALTSQPQLILLDEPFSSLHQSLRRELWTLLLDLQREHSLTILLITHDLTEAYFLASDISFLLHGKIQQQGPKAQVFRRPATIEVARFLGFKNYWEATILSRAQGVMLLDCPALGTKLRVASSDPFLLSLGNKVFVCITSNDIMLRDDSHPPRPDENLIQCTFLKHHDLGVNQKIYFQVANQNGSLEIEIPYRTASRFSLLREPQPCLLGLSETALFCLEL
jgi:ABC-type Fe3+/spermidine/putrescine transport system ATPase subunit